MPIAIVTFDPATGIQSHDDLNVLRDLPPTSKVWVDIETNEQQLITFVAQQFDLHELTVEDCLAPGHAPKLDDYGRYLFVIFRSLLAVSELEGEWKQHEEYREGKRERLDDEDARVDRYTRKVAIYLSENFIVTFRRFEVSWLDALVRRVSSSEDLHQFQNLDILFHRVVDVLFDRFQRGLNFFEKVIDLNEDAIIRDPDAFDLGDILDLKHELNSLRLTARLQRAITAKLAIDPAITLIRKQQRRYLKDIDDHALEIANVLDKQVDAVQSLRDAHFAFSNIRLSDTMRILAVITTIAAPINIIVGVYGMNFESMPLLQHPFGFWITLGTILLFSLAALLFFRKKRWL